MEFKDKVVLITGASSGIGAGTAEYLSKLHAIVILVGRNFDNLKAVKSKCSYTEKNSEPFIIQADMTLESDVVRVVEEVVNKFGKINILINNAGIIGNGTIETTTLEQYDKIMNTNMRAVYHLTMLAVPYLIKSEGCIVNVSSVNGMRSFPGVLAYNISKAALDQFTRCIALELAPKQVRVNSVNPGVIITDIHRRGGLDDDAYKRFLEHSKTTHALGRPGLVSEVASAIAFLASDSSSFITGMNLAVDGGRHAMCPR